MKNDFARDIAVVLGLVGVGLLCYAAWTYNPLLGEVAIGLVLVMYYYDTQKELRRRKERE